MRFNTDKTQIHMSETANNRIGNVNWCERVWMGGEIFRIGMLRFSARNPMLVFKNIEILEYYQS